MIDCPRCFRCDARGGYGPGEWWGRYCPDQPHGILLICPSCRDRVRAIYGARWRTLEPVWVGELMAQRERVEDALFGRQW